MIIKIENEYGRTAKDLRSNAKENTLAGAQAALETFYYSFNNKCFDTFNSIWANSELIQLNNPLGGIQRGITPITELYKNIFEGPASVWVELSDIVVYFSGDTAVFAGRERGAFTVNDKTVDLNIRTSRVFQYLDDEQGWRQVHHHGSIDNAALLNEYQTTVTGK